MDGRWVYTPALPNLFSLCGKALQIDANLGAASSIAEMLVQSHQEAMHLLPALRAEWSSGSMHGCEREAATWWISTGQAVRSAARRFTRAARRDVLSGRVVSRL